MIEKRISVIIPIYNSEKRLQILIDCLQAQTFKDFEVLLINDGSTDTSGMICNRVASNDNRFQVFHLENNGVSAARNFGLHRISTSYVTFLDSDDEIPNNYLETLYNCHKLNQADITVCDVFVVSEGEEKRRFTYDETNLTSQQAMNYVLSREYINSGPYAKLFGRNIIKDLEFPSLKAYEDIVFVVKAFDRAQKISITNKTEYRYIQNNNGAMNSFSANPDMDIITATEFLIDFIKTHGELSPKCYYTTLSHLLEYIIIVSKDKRNCTADFSKAAKKLLRHNVFEIIKSKSFHYKEKILFILVSLGFMY